MSHNPREVLPQILSGHYSEPEEDRSVCLKETEEKAKINKLTIKGCPENTILIKMDKFPPPDCLGETYRNRCDYVLVTQNSVIFLELKSSGESGRLKIIDQFRGATAIFEYIGAAVRLFLGSDKWNLKHIKNYYFAFKGRKGSWRRETGFLGKENPSTPEQFKNIHVNNGETIYFEKFLRNP